jgi:hypothetical protein
MIRQLRIEDDAPTRDEWQMACHAAAVLRDLHELLSHPSLDLAPAERERIEHNWWLLRECLPSRIDQPLLDEAPEPAAGEAPF